jgi:hypothetical protein
VKQNSNWATPISAYKAVLLKDCINSSLLLLLSGQTGPWSRALPAKGLPIICQDNEAERRLCHLTLLLHWRRITGLILASGTTVICQLEDPCGCIQAAPAAHARCNWAHLHDHGLNHRHTWATC